jgi:hypothetical protein
MLHLVGLLVASLRAPILDEIGTFAPDGNRTL